MINRRSLMLGAAAVAVAPAAATALPARVIESAPSLPFIPCDGRELPIAQYLDLFKQIGRAYGGSEARQTFCVPDLRTRLTSVSDPDLDRTFPTEMRIVALQDTSPARVPVGFIMRMVADNG